MFYGPIKPKPYWQSTGIMHAAILLRLFIQHHAARASGGWHIYQALIAAAPKPKANISLSLYKRPIHQHIYLPQQVPHCLLAAALQHFVGIASITPNIQSVAVQLPRQLCQKPGLAKRLTAAKGYSLQQRIGQNIPQKPGWLYQPSPLKIMGLGVMAAKAVVRAALRKYRVAISLAIYDGLAYSASDPQPMACHCHLPYICQLLS